MGHCMSSGGGGEGGAPPKTKKKPEIKIILLGIGASGKTTFSKQMQIIHIGSFDKERAQGFRLILLTNILIGLKAIAAKVKDLESTENYKKSRWIQTVDEMQTDWNEELIEKVKSLWADPGTQDTWREIKDDVVIQMEYLMDNLDRFIEPDYIPSNDDILRARQRTTGETSLSFEDDERAWNLVDVGGQYNERTKWNSFFQGEKVPQAIIFFLAVDEYNVANTELRTEEYKTKFELALSVFKSMMCEDGAVLDHKLCRVVFLNKIDIFTEKMKDDRKWGEFKKAVDYDGERDATKAMDFLEQKLKGMAEGDRGKQKGKVVNELAVHVTNALDTELMRVLIKDIKSAIIRMALSDLGML